MYLLFWVIVLISFIAMVKERSLSALGLFLLIVALMIKSPLVFKP